MPSFKTISLIAAFAFAAFTVASPMPAPAPEPVAAAYPAAELAVRGGGYTPIPATLEKCHHDVELLVVDLTVNLHSTVPLDLQIKVVVGKIVAVIKLAIVEVGKCKGYPSNDYLYHNGKLWLATDVALLLYKILKLVFFAIFNLLKLVGILKVHIILPLVKEIAIVIGDLLTLLFILVVGLKDALLPLICAVDGVVSVAAIIVYLGVPSLILCLGGLIDILPKLLPIKLL